MIYILIPALIILMGLTLFSLLKGLNAFRQALDADVDPEGAHLLQLKQNKMMWARIKYQGAAIAIVVILMAVAR
ncbi:hypothetical protein WG901_08930 [Novosphingobium sp. PS1R-30]|uniref:HIG1 domain-containing protein n=1 Tax=Novosphingobium anseongense TaxID=3133436 RepID=A0ABU8RUH3_9SPHN|nr:MAG: hypothetical protein EOO76_06265 [Novosphingobium sp.]